MPEDLITKWVFIVGGAFGIAATGFFLKIFYLYMDDLVGSRKGFLSKFSVLVFYVFLLACSFASVVVNVHVLVNINIEWLKLPVIVFVGCLFVGAASIIFWKIKNKK